MTGFERGAYEPMGALDKLTVVVVIVSFAQFDYMSFLGLGFVTRWLRDAAVFLTMLAFLRRRATIDSFLLLWLAFSAWIITSTVINGSDVSAAFGLAGKVMLPAVFLAAYKDDYHFVLRVLYIVLGILVIANFVTILLYPHGLYETGVTNIAHENWLLGFKNRHIVFYLPLLLATFLRAVDEGLSLDKIILILIVPLSAVLANSSTAIICMALVIVFGFLPTFRRRYKIFNARLFFMIGIALFVFIIVLRVQDRLSSFVVNLLGKDSTFSNRTTLWNIAIDMISKRPLAGWGEWSAAQKHTLYSSNSVVSAHNQILEYAFVGGLVLVTIYLVINVKLVARLQRSASERHVQFAAVVYLAMMVVLLTEAYTDMLFYLLYSMLWLAPTLVPGPERRAVKARGGS